MKLGQERRDEKPFFVAGQRESVYKVVQERVERERGNAAEVDGAYEEP